MIVEGILLIVVLVDGSYRIGYVVVATASIKLVYGSVNKVIGSNHSILDWGFVECVVNLSVDTEGQCSPGSIGGVWTSGHVEP